MSLAVALTKSTNGPYSSNQIYIITTDDIPALPIWPWTRRLATSDIHLLINGALSICANNVLNNNAPYLKGHVNLSKGLQGLQGQLPC